MATQRTFHGARMEVSELTEWTDGDIDDGILAYLEDVAKKNPQDSFENIMLYNGFVVSTELEPKKFKYYRDFFNDEKLKYISTNQQMAIGPPPIPNVEYQQYSSEIQRDCVYFRSLNPEDIVNINGGNIIYPRKIVDPKTKKIVDFPNCEGVNIYLDSGMMFMNYHKNGTKPCNNSAGYHIRSGSADSFTGSRFISMIDGNIPFDGFRISACWSACGPNKGVNRGYFVVLNTKSRMESGQQNRLVDLREGVGKLGTAATFSKGSNEVLAIDYISDPDMIIFESICVDLKTFKSVKSILAFDLIRNKDWDRIPDGQYIKISTNRNCGPGDHMRYILVKKLSDKEWKTMGTTSFSISDLTRHTVSTSRDLKPNRTQNKAQPFDLFSYGSKQKRRKKSRKSRRNTLKKRPRKKSKKRSKRSKRSTKRR